MKNVDYLNPDRINHTVEGIPFDQSTFEDLFDVWTPKEDFPILLNCQYHDLDRFCHEVYGQEFSVVYDTFVKISDNLWLKKFKQLAENGNQTCIKFISEQYMKHRVEDNNKEFKVSICTELPKEDEH